MRFTHVTHSLACAASIGMLACGGSSGSDSDGDDMPPAPTPASQEVQLTATDHAFAPNQVSTEVGATVKFVLHNAAAQQHSIEIELPSGEVELLPWLNPGETGELTATMPPTPGSFMFNCPVPGHRELGMTGTIDVRAKPGVQY